METLISTIETAIKKEIPTGCYVRVWKRNRALGGAAIGIFFAANDYNINNVEDQKPQAVSLTLDPATWELEVQAYSCMGGQSVKRVPNKDIPAERHLAMKGVKVAFRKPQANETAVLKAIAKFAHNWRETIRNNKDVLMYSDKVDYSKF